MHKRKPFTPFLDDVSFEAELKKNAWTIGRRHAALPRLDKTAVGQVIRYWRLNLDERCDSGQDPISDLNYISTLGLLCTAISARPVVKFTLDHGRVPVTSVALRQCLLDYPTQYLALYVTLQELQHCEAEYEGVRDPNASLAGVTTNAFCSACADLAKNPRNGEFFTTYFEI